MKSSKKGQGASPQSYISLLIFIIGVLLIVYILMLPPADRAELLDQNRTTHGDGEKDDISVVLEREPGTLTDIAEDEIIEDLPAFNLFTRTDATVLVNFDSVYIKKSLFEEQKRNITFNVDNFENTDNLVLSFRAPMNKGRLSIELNGQEIMNKDLDSASPAPLRLPRDLLQAQNRIVFSVSGPGIMFWDTNEYSLENLKITADVTDTSGQRNTQFLFITEQERENLESFELSFAVDCKASEVAPLEILLNKKQIYFAIPECGSLTKVPAVAPSRVQEGENDILFTSTKGFYQFYRVEAKLNLEEPIFPTYYFTLSQDRYADIEEDTADINVTLLFANAEERKKAFVRVNGARLDINTFDGTYNREISEFVREGNNAVEIIPDMNRIDILELRVVLAE